MSDEVIPKEDGPITEAVEASYDNVWDNPSAVSFEELEAVDTVGDLVEDVSELSFVYRILMGHIQDSQTIEDKVSAIKKLSGEYVERLNGLIGEHTTEKSLFTKAINLLHNKAFKTEMGKKFHASDYAYVPDASKPSTWKLRLSETPGKVTVGQLGRAAAAFSKGGFRGNRVQLPAKAVSAAKSKIRAAYKRLGKKDEDIPASVKESGMQVWKENDEYRWVAHYSNCYRDDDAIPEIISSESNKEFIRKIDASEIPMPVLLHWHLKGTEWGQTDWMAFDEDNMVIVAAGYVIPGHEKEAEILASRTDIQTSHGMPIQSIVRDESDPTIIKQHVTVEISDLPSEAAANSLSTFEILKEESMAIPEAKKQYLRDLGYTEDEIAKIEDKNSNIKATAEQQGRESKENQESTPQAETKPTTEPGTSKETQPVVQQLTAEDVAKAVAEVMKPVTDAIGALNDRVKAIETQVKENQEKALPLAPPASLAAMIAQQMSVIGSKEAQVKGNSTLAKAGPAETEPEKEKLLFSFPENPLVASVISNILNKNNGAKE